MQHGEIIELGRHRLMCGDATCSDHVMNLLDGAQVDMVLTDPPYGISIQRKDGRVGSHSGKRRMLRDKYMLYAAPHIPMLNDKDTQAARLHYEIVRHMTDKIIFWGGSYMTDFLPVSGGWIFWDKNRRGMDFSDGELAWRSWGNKIKYYKQTWNGVCMEGSYKLNGRTAVKARLHPTQKPVELFATLIEDFGDDCSTVLDCFAGSGSTLMACEVTGRTAYLMELSPEYCDVIIKRYLAYQRDYPLG